VLNSDQRVLKAAFRVFNPALQVLYVALRVYFLYLSHTKPIIMLKFNLEHITKARGILNPRLFLRENGFSINVVNLLLSGNAKQISPANLEKLCILFNCTINDLYEWQPDKDQKLPKDHSIHQLKKKRTKPI
jgi:DNA-binding Xre family transcriptional regulator